MNRRLATPLYLLPALAVYGLFVLTPIAESFRLSLFRWPFPSAQPVFCGLRNFADLLRDAVFWKACQHNAALLLMSLAVQLPAAIALAVLLHYPTRGRTLFRTAFFAPMVMPTAAIAVLWQFIYAPEQGLLSRLIALVRPGFAYPWLADPRTTLLWIFVTICWRYIGFHMVLYMAALGAIPEELYEAARLDGAGEWQACRYITLPMLRPMIGISATLSIIGSLKYFDLVYLMAGGVPEESRELMATYIYRLAFDEYQGRFGYGSAAAVMLFVIALLVIVPLQARSRRRSPDNPTGTAP
ncbi:MAG: sugar ABC transporter permease [Lentisphaeria bacterium]|nr:sugar ABC transporter permease [Lentisphaeria bacterium]